MKRRTFLAAGLLAVPSFAILGACGGDDDGGSDLVQADAGNEFFTIQNQDGSGHTHTVMILCRDLLAENSVSYVATGSHEHTIELTADQLATISSGSPVEITFTDGHAHSFTIQMPDGQC